MIIVPFLDIGFQYSANLATGWSESTTYPMEQYQR